MVDRGQLEELGFSEELIDEITRVADCVRKSEVKQAPLLQSSNSFYFDSSKIMTDDSLILR